MKKYCVLAATDSALKYCHLLAEGCATEQDSIELVALKEAKRDVSQSIALNMGIETPIHEMPLKRFAENIGKYDAIFMFHENSVLYNQFLDALEQFSKQAHVKKRPIVIVGFIGIAMDPLLSAITTRQGADIICVNTKRDYQNALEVCQKMGFDTSAIVQTGYPMAKKQSPRNLKTLPNSGRRIVFATQPHWPNLNERIYILWKLVEAASRYPHDTFIVKLRLPPNGRSIHMERYHYEVLFNRMRVQKPDNLVFQYGNMQSVLDETDILLTVSSTAVVEAIARDIPIAIIRDFGMRNEIGLEHFCGSGAFASLDEVFEGKINALNPHWLEENGFGSNDNLQALNNKLEALIQRQESQGQVLPMPERYLSAANTPYIFRNHHIANGFKKRPIKSLRDLIYKLIPIASKRDFVFFYIPLVLRSLKK